MDDTHGDVNWSTTLFLFGCIALGIGGTWAYVATFGWTWFDAVFFFVAAWATGLAITVGYHRQFAHKSFDANGFVKVVTAMLGAASFEGSALGWASEHRYHHKYTDHDGDPYDPYNVQKGFFHAHMGWLLRYRQPELPTSNVADLARDPFLAWQDRNIAWIMVAMGLGLPTVIGLAHAAIVGRPLVAGLMSGLFVAGFLRVAVIHQCTFFINSLCHYVGRQPFNSGDSSRDSGLVAFLTFGEGYHNFHHTFQTDYRNGYRGWHFDPGKWIIWMLSKIGWARRLRRTPEETILLARMREMRRRLQDRAHVSLTEAMWERLNHLEERAEKLHLEVRIAMQKVRKSAGEAVHRTSVKSSRELQHLQERFRAVVDDWYALAGEFARAAA